MNTRWTIDKPLAYLFIAIYGVIWMTIFLNLAQISNKCVPEKVFNCSHVANISRSPWQIITDEKNHREVYLSECNLLMYTVMHAHCPTTMWTYATNINSHSTLQHKMYFFTHKNNNCNMRISYFICTLAPQIKVNVPLF